jgi:hypothetical protein
MELKTGAYLKWYDREYNFVSPKLQEVLFLTADQQWDLRPQDGRRRAYGFELTLASPPRDGVTYSAGGSLFDVKNRWADGTWYDDWTNVRYTGSLSIGARLLRRHSFSFTLQGHGGRPYCPEMVVEDCIGRKSSLYEPGNYYARRLDRYISTHVRYGFEASLRRLAIETFVEAINLLNRQPVLEYRFNGESYLAIRPFGIVPIVGVKIAW